MVLCEDVGGLVVQVVVIIKEERYEEVRRVRGSFVRSFVRSKGTSLTRSSPLSPKAKPTFERVLLLLLLPASALSPPCLLSALPR